MKSNRLVFFFLGWMGMVFYFMQRWIYGPLIPSLMTYFNVDKTALGVIGAASMWGYMFTPIAAGLLSDRFGRKHAVLFGIFGFSAMTAICGLTNSTSQLFAGRFVTGMVEAFYFIPLIAFTMELFPERPGFFLTFITSGSSVGWFLGPAMAGWLLDLTGNWRTPFIVTGLAGLVIAVLLLIFWPEQKKTARSGPVFDKSILKPANLGLLFLLALTAMFQIAAEFGFTMWFPVFLRTEVGQTATVAGLMAGLYGIGQAFGRPFFGWVSDRLGYRSVGITCGAILGLTMILILSVTHPLPRGLFTFQAGFIGAAVMGTLWTFTGLVFPTFKGLALGVLTTFAYATASFSPIAIGYIGDHYSVSAGLWWICVPSIFCAVASFLCTYLVRSGSKQGMG
jgi:MFS family permease